MRILPLLLFCIFIIGFGQSCKKKEIELPEETELGVINFMSPQIGQKSHYRLFRGEDIRDNSNNNFEYLDDTLVVEIISEDENGFLTQEYLTPHSRSLNGENNVAFADSTWYYYLSIEEQVLQVKQLTGYNRTRLFFLSPGGDQGLNLQPIASPRLEVLGWKTNVPFAEEFTAGMLQDYRQFEKSYPHLNVVIENRPMQEGLPGYMHIFSAEEGLVRSAEYSDLNGLGFGWDAL